MKTAETCLGHPGFLKVTFAKEKKIQPTDESGTFRIHE